MWPFCKHDWVIESRVVAKPLQKFDVGPESRMSELLLERLVFGQTTIVWRCTKCKHTRREEMLGLPDSS